MGVGGLIAPVDRIFSDGINEVIVTTRNNAAPMGIIRKNDSLSMIVFRTSHTAENIIRDNLVVVNIIHDPVLFVITAFEDLTLDRYTCETREGREIFRLKDCPDWIACTATVLNMTPEKLFVRVDPFYAEITPRLPMPVHRGLNNVIEATVHATRFVLNQDPELARLIRHHGELVMRCGGEQDKKAISRLYTYVNTITPHTFG